MKIYDYIPQRNYKRTSGLLLILISASVGFFTVPAFLNTLTFRWIFQLSGILCLAAMIYIVSRYMLKTVVYEIYEDDEVSGRLYFTATEVSNKGRSRVTVCRFYLRSVEGAELLYADSGDFKARKKALVARARAEHRKQFSYCPDPLSSPICCLFVTEGGEKFFIKLAPDQRLFEYFDKRS